MPKISVIVPVYKVEPYLHRCVSSILNQTYQDFELILVDDGSPDRCGELCDGYAETDARVHVIHQANGGLSAARNAGTDWVMANSPSQWITYADSDDWLHPQTLEVLLRAAEEMNVKISVCGYQETEGENPALLPEELEPQCWTPRDFYTQKFINATVAWGKLYHRSCLENVRYPVGKIHEDEYVTYRLLFSQERIAVVPGGMYAYFRNAAGITRVAWSPKRLHAWDAYDQQLAFFAAREDRELLQWRYRKILENVRVNLAAAEEGYQAPDRESLLSSMKKRAADWVLDAWKGGYMDFWADYDLLANVYPLRARAYRLLFELRAKFGRK